MNFCGLATQAPMRGVPRTKGSDSGLILARRASPLGAIVSPADIGDDAGEIADAPILIHKARLFLALRTITQELHELPFPKRLS